MAISQWSTSPSNNASGVTNIDWSEGMAPAQVNNSARQQMADVANWYRNSAEWIDRDDSATYSSGSIIQFSGSDLTGIYNVNRRIKVTASTPGTLYGRITASSTSGSNTLVTISWDSTSVLSNEAISDVAVGLVSGSSSARSITLSGISDSSTFSESLLGSTDAAAYRTSLGLGTAATLNSGTSSGNLAVLSTGGVFSTGVIAAGTETKKGIVELASSAEASALTSTGVVMTPVRTRTAVGSALNIQSTTKTDTFTTTSTSWTDVTGMSVSITPQSTSDKVLVHVNVNGDIVSSGTRHFMRILRGATPISVGASAGSRTQATAEFDSDSRVDVLSVMYLDSPGSTSTQTYKVQVMLTGSTLYINRDATDTDNATYARTASTITTMLIPG